MGKVALSMLDVAEQDAKTREALCLAKSPHQCLALKFGAPLTVHPHVLLATLNLDKKRFKFDTSKLAMNLPDSTRSSISESLREDGVLFIKHDLYIDLREPLQPRDLASLVYRLAHLNGIIDVRLHKIFSVDYSCVKVAKMLG